MSRIAAVSPLDSTRRKLMGSPLTSCRSTEAKAFVKPSYSPISTPHYRDSATKTTQLQSEPSIPTGRQRDTNENEPRRGSYTEPQFRFQPQQRFLTQDSYGSQQERPSKETESDHEDKVPTGSKFSKTTGKFEYRKIAETRSRSPREELDRKLYKLLQEREEGLRRHEEFQREQDAFSKVNPLITLTGSAATISYGDLLSPVRRTTMSNMNTGPNSKAYVKAMKALQDRVITLETQAKTVEREREKERREAAARNEKVERSLQEAERRNRELEEALKQLEKEKKVWIKQTESIEKEREECQEERERILREKEAAAREKDQWMKEKEEWMQIKEGMTKKLYDMEKSKGEIDDKNKMLEEKVSKLEKEQADQRKTYHQHLRSMALKNEGLVIEVTQIKEFYEKLIREFEGELSKIEEEHTEKIGEYEMMVEELKKRNKDLEELFTLRQKEYSNSSSKTVKAVSVYDSSAKTGLKLNAIAEEPSPATGGKEEESKRRMENKEMSISGNNQMSKINDSVSTAVQRNRNSRVTVETTHRSAYEMYGEVSREISYGGRTKQNSQYGGVWTPNEKMIDLDERKERVARLVRTAEAREEPVLILGEERREGEGINRNLNDEISKYLRLGDPPTEKQRNFPTTMNQNQENIGTYRDVKEEQVGTAEFPKRITFADELVSSAGKEREAESISIAQSRSPSNAFSTVSEKRSPRFESARDSMLGEKEQELEQANGKYQELLNKIQETNNPLEKSKLRSQLIELTDEIQRINEQIYQIKKNRTVA